MERYRGLIIGMGNAYRGDDAVGLRIAQHLGAQVHPCFPVVVHHGDGLALIELWQDKETVFVVDAAHSGAPPGTIYRFEAHREPIPARLFHYSTHAIGLPGAIELSRALHRLPSRLVVYGIEGCTFQSGAGLSEEVEVAAQEVAARVNREAGLAAEE
ncbi:MAG: hydrogenase maturation protease [Acidobacteria bacterium]|nr:hydrogenase maturation protease [Acidobacteriota bacterium]MBI3655202.1 hydrogenase maturation protease [Acidobacteriota bacterium]